MAGARPLRRVIFLANTGHELGHLGNTAAILAHPGRLEGAKLCFHLGANWGCSMEALVIANARLAAFELTCDTISVRRKKQNAAKRAFAIPKIEAEKTGTPSILLQVADFGAQQLAIKALAAQGISEARVAVVDGTKRPVGEARELYDQGARYLSLIGIRKKDFHMPEDCEVNQDMAELTQMTRATAAAVLEVALAPDALPAALL